MAPATVALFLHAHLPFVRHPEHEDFLEERWLFEAVVECYLPLIDTLQRLHREGVPARLTLSLSPTLLNMLADRLLRARTLRHLDRQVELAEKEERRTRSHTGLHPLAQHNLERFSRARISFLDDWQQDLIAAFRTLRDSGVLEIATTAATHAVLPLLAPSPERVRAQIDIAAAESRRFFGTMPEGFWLPECAWAAGLDEPLRRAGFRYCIVDTHGLTRATPRPVYGAYAPIATSAGLAVFGRDPESAEQVWSAESGYPADPWYRDFYRDVGFDLDLDYIRPYIAPTGARVPTGIKYHRVTGKTTEKALYDPARALERVGAHATHFVEGRLRQATWLARAMDRPPIIVCPYDAELFGHWWHEGPLWLEEVLRRIAETPGLVAGTPGDDLRVHRVLQRADPAPSTWGARGHHDVWLAPEADWIYRHLDATSVRLRTLCRRYPSADERTRRALTQALREFLLAEASDWAFMMSRHTTAEYATRRTGEHLRRCQQLCAEVEAGAVDDLRLTALEDSDCLFPTLDYRILL